MFAEIDGVVNDRPVPKTVDDDDVEYQFTVPTAFALKTTVPVPQREFGVVEFNVGNAKFTVTTTVAVAKQPVVALVSVTVYVVVADGFAVGFAIEAEESPVTGDQE